MPRTTLDPCQLEFGLNASEIRKAKTKDTQHRTNAYTPGAAKVMGADECRKLCEKIGLEYLAGYESRVLEYVITTEDCDRYGDIIRVKGCDDSKYKKNPVILFIHNNAQLPVGNSLTWGKATTSSGKPCVNAVGLFFDDRVDDSHVAETTFKMARSGALKGASIGFLPSEWNDPREDSEREKLGLGRYGVEFTKWELLEWSPVPIPANPEALQVKALIAAVRAGTRFELRDFETMVSHALLQADDVDTLEFLQSKAEDNRLVVTPVEAGSMEISIERVLTEVDERHSQELKALTDSIHSLKTNIDVLSVAVETLLAVGQQAAVSERKLGPASVTKEQAEQYMRAALLG